MAEETTIGSHGWRGGLVREVRSAASAVRGAPRAVVVRETALQVLVAALSGVALFAGGAAPVPSLATAAVIVGTALVLAARLRWPALATVATGGLLAVAGLGTLLAAPLVAFCAGRRASEPLHGVLVVGAAGLLTFSGFTAYAVISDISGVDAPLSALFAALPVVGSCLALPAAGGIVVGQRRPAVRLLAERNAYLESVRSLTASQARLEERARITREMHDVLGHRLSLLSVHAGALEVRAAQDAPRLSEQAQLVRTTAVAALDELRTTLEATRSVSGHASSGSRAAAAVEVPLGHGDVEAIADAWRVAGADVTVIWHDVTGEALDPRVGRTVDRVVREGLTNASKHAPGTAVTIGVQADRDRVVISVHNTAPGPGTPEGRGTGMGLLGVAERADLLGGSAAWGSTGTGGFELEVQVPARPPAVADPRPEAGTRRPGPLLPPPPVREEDVLSWRRTTVVAVLVLGMALPVALTLMIFVDELF